MIFLNLPQEEAKREAAAAKAAEQGRLQERERQARQRATAEAAVARAAAVLAKLQVHLSGFEALPDGFSWSLNVPDSPSRGQLSLGVDSLVSQVSGAVDTAEGCATRCSLFSSHRILQF